jgi:hypothetical protein
MDEKLEKALEFSNYQKTLQLQKENLKLRLEHMLIVKIGNNVFTCSIELINFMHTSLYYAKESIIILDVYGNPVKITQLRDCLDLFIAVYNKAYEEYYEKYESLKKARNIEKVIS